MMFWQGLAVGFCVVIIIEIIGLIVYAVKRRGK